MNDIIKHEWKNCKRNNIPRRDIYVGHAHKAHDLHIHRMSISCFVPRKKMAISQVRT